MRGDVSDESGGCAYKHRTTVEDTVLVFFHSPWCVSKLQNSVLNTEYFERVHTEGHARMQRTTGELQTLQKYDERFTLSMGANANVKFIWNMKRLLRDKLHKDQNGG